MEFPVLDMQAKQEVLRKSSELDSFDERVVFFKLLYNQVRLIGDVMFSAANEANQFFFQSISGS